MKTLKRFLVFAIATVMLVATIAFVGCSKPDGSALSGSMKIVIAPEDNSTPTVFEVDLSNFTNKDNVDDVILYLAGEGKLCYKGGYAAYGLFLEALGVPVPAASENDYPSVNYIIEQDASAGKYIYTYTSVEKDQNDGEYKTEKEYDGVTVIDSLNGVSAMTIEDGAIIYFAIVVWG